MISTVTLHIEGLVAGFIAAEDFNNADSRILPIDDIFLSDYLKEVAVKIVYNNCNACHQKQKPFSFSSTIRTRKKSLTINLESLWLFSVI